MKRVFGMIVLLICIYSSPAFAQRYALFPQFVSGEDASGNQWICEMFFTNQDIVPVLGIEIAFYESPDGNPVAVESDLFNANSYSFDLEPGATKRIQIDPEADYVEGYVVVTYPSNGAPVRATLIYRYVDAEGNVTVEVGVPHQEHGSQLTAPLGYHYSFPVAMNPSQRTSTALVLVNPQFFYSTAQTIIISLIDTDGNVEATALVHLEPGQHLADYLNQDTLFKTFFDAFFSEHDDYTGSISISSPFGVGVLALRQDKNAFGAISTDGGPILGPFASDILQPMEDPEKEVEPNDDTIEAQIIVGSTVIAGNIGEEEDKDYFAFAGNEGDIVSVICDAQLAGSWLDSVLEIYDGSMNKIAENDQNGWSPELFLINDSFIQVELPADDTYYIIIKDYFDEGDPDNFMYTLYVKITPGD